MRPFNFLVTALLLCSWFMPGVRGEIAPDELPMYGGIPRTEQQQRADAQFIQEGLAHFGSREAASQRTLQKGWELYTQGDRQTAIRRFNQAWLLTPENAEVFHAFGVYQANRGEGDEAIKMYKKALEINPQHALAMCNLGRSYKDGALQLAKTDGAAKEKEIWSLLQEAIKLCENASRVATLKEDLSYIYYQWAIVLSMVGDTTGAWDKIHRSRDYGGEFIEPGFLEELSQEMPEPR